MRSPRQPEAPLSPGGDADRAEGGAIRFGDFTLLPVERRLQKAGESVALGTRAFDLLVALVERAPRVVSKDELFEQVWPGLAGEEANLRYQINGLRKALGREPAGGRFISTVHGRGYCFVAAVSRSPSGPDGGAQPESTFRTNLPLPAHPIVERERELAELEEALRGHRLVTVLGSGGVGKTRLAVELGRRVLAHYPDGVWLIDLAPLSDPALIVSAAASVLNLSADVTAEAFARRIGNRAMLLIFDNCEHLIDAVAALFEVLTAQAGAATVLATSQESLRVAGEQVYRLEPLPPPPVGAAEIASYGAVTLFVELARRADRGFALSETNAERVAEICRRLDGVPLALEMAAARLPLLGIEGLRSGLAERLSLLKRDQRQSSGRHASLRHLADWSYGLLDGIDQQVFRRLAIFPGSFALEAAVAIMAPVGLDHWGTLDALWRLQEKSLIVVEPDAAPRFRLLETLRLHALEHLQASGDRDAVAALHARHFADHLERAEAAWETTPDLDWIALHRSDIDDLRAALDWVLAEPGRRRLALGLAGPGLHLLNVLSLIAEGRRYGDRLVALIDDDTPPAMAASLLSQAARFWRSRLGPRGFTDLERAVNVYREIGDPIRLGWPLAALANLSAQHGDHERAVAIFLEARSLVASMKVGKARLEVMITLGVLAVRLDRLEEAREYLRFSLQIARDIRSLNEATCLSNLAWVEYNWGDIEAAIELSREAIVRARATPGYRSLGRALQNLAACLLAQGRSEEARPVAVEALARLNESDLAPEQCLQIWAVLAAAEGHLVEAAQLIGFVDAERDRKRELREPLEIRLYDELARRLEAGLSADDVRARTSEGALWSEAEAMAFTATRLVAVRPPRELG